MKRIILILIVCFLGLVAVIQTSTAIYFARRTATLDPADLVVVFPGGSRRIITGIDLVKDDLAPRFMVISTTAPHLQELLTKNGAPETISTLPGGESRSTFEDVYQTVQTIQDNQLRSVILVTSSYHLPRSMFLLRVSLRLSGQDVRIQGFSVKEERGLSKNLVQYPNEAIKLWGSILEMTGQHVSGQLLLDAPILKKAQGVFKKTFLL
ncbi:YdcF family protein [Desulfocastanea catecholica]